MLHRKVYLNFDGLIPLTRVCKSL